MNGARVLLACLFALAAFGTAEAKEAESPQAAAAVAMAAAKKGDWATYTHSMHPDALAKAKSMFGAVVAADASGRVRELFFGVDDTKSFDALSDSSCFVALMTNLTEHMPAFAEVMRSAEFHVIGTLPEGKDLAHVVYRTDAKAEELEITRTSVLSLRRYGKEWRMLLTGNIEGLAARLAQMSGARH
ncbi:MAG TPA: hypothetical protein VFV24_02220 [Candidatus Eisenbacteria bacterium]|nr:hypothetical protein [Candidatus Eisenbacteria bacterium]